MVGVLWTRWIGSETQGGQGGLTADGVDGRVMYV